MGPEPLTPGTAIGFVGLGNMGGPMASHLVAAGYAVRGYDLSEAARARFGEQAGATAVQSAAAAAEGVRAVVLMLPDSSVVEHVVLSDGLLEGTEAGACLIDMSSSEPARTQALAKTAAARGVELIDAPVSGGVRGAVAATLSIMVGGTKEQFDACAPLLGSLGQKVLHVGPVGSGHALKALNNLLSATTLLASAEAFLVARRFGLDPQVFIDVINGSTGRSYSTEHKLPDFVLPESWTSGFGLRLMVKDMRIAAALADATGTPLRLGGLSTELWERAAAELPPDADHTEIARWLAAELEES